MRYSRKPNQKFWCWLPTAQFTVSSTCRRDTLIFFPLQRFTVRKMPNPTARQLNEWFDLQSIFGFESNGIISLVGIGFRWELVLRSLAVRPPALLILTIGELLHRKGAIFFCCGCVPSGFKLRCCTIVNKPFMNRPQNPFHKKIYSLWNRLGKPVQENGARCEFKFRCLGSRSSGINYLWFRNGLYQFLTRKA